MEVIEKKIESGGKEIEEKPKKAPKPTKVIDLVSVLQKSLAQTAKRPAARSRSRKKYLNLGDVFSSSNYQRTC